MTAQVPAKEKELALGAALASEFRKHSTPLAVPDAGPYAQALARRLGGAHYPWHVEVVTDDLGGSTHEPTAFPGGYLFVPAALFRAARDEAEFAGILAHAMAHLIDRHGLQQGTGVPAYLGGGGTVPLRYLNEQRRFEIAADRRAVTMLAGAGYDPAALKAYVRREQVDDDGGVFSRMPVREMRTLAIDTALREIPAPPQSRHANPEFERIRSAVITTAGAQ